MTTTCPRGKPTFAARCVASWTRCTAMPWSRLSVGGPGGGTKWMSRITYWRSCWDGSGSRSRSAPTIGSARGSGPTPAVSSRSTAAARPTSGWRSSATTSWPTSGTATGRSVRSRTPTGPRSTRSTIPPRRASPRSRPCGAATAILPTGGSRSTTTTWWRSTPCSCAPRRRILPDTSRLITRTHTIRISWRSILGTGSPRRPMGRRTISAICSISNGTMRGGPSSSPSTECPRRVGCRTCSPREWTTGDSTSAKWRPWTSGSRRRYTTPGSPEGSCSRGWTSGSSTPG